MAPPQYFKGRPSPWIVQYREFQGVRRGKITTRAFSVKDDALAFEEKIRRERQLIKVGMPLPKGDVSFFDFSKVWVKRRFESKLAKSTVEPDERRLRNFWIPEIGDMPLGMIKTSDILTRLNKIQFDLHHSVADRNRHRALMHKLFHDAFMEGKVDANPVARIPLEKETPVKKPTRVGSDEDFEKYLAELRKQGPHYGMLGSIMGLTGCRISEAIGLQYGDTHDGVVIFRRIEERAGGSKIVERTKGTGEVEELEDAHVVPLLPQLAKLIKGHRERSRFKSDADFIACNPETGRYTPYDAWKGASNRAIEAAGVGHFTAHAVRRYFATALKKAGHTRADIREWLGHSTEAVTARYDLKEIPHLIEKAKLLRFGLVKTRRQSDKRQTKNRPVRD